jgi:hypothetical protein
VGDVPIKSTANDYETAWGRAVLSSVAGIAGASVINNCVSISQVDYDALVNKDAATLYVIV